MRAILFVLLFPTLCLAASWMPVEDSDGTLNVRPVSKEGDWVTVDVYDRTESMKYQASFDCKKEVVTVSSFPERTEVMPGSRLSKVMKTACNNRYAFWK